LKRRGIDLIGSHRKNCTRARLQDGRKLRQYERRWRVERTFAWLGNFRRLLVRWEEEAMLAINVARSILQYLDTKLPSSSTH
jgi:transposase